MKKKQKLKPLRQVSPCWRNPGCCTHSLYACVYTYVYYIYACMYVRGTRIARVIAGVGRMTDAGRERVAIKKRIKRRNVSFLLLLLLLSLSSFFFFFKDIREGAVYLHVESLRASVDSSSHSLPVFFYSLIYFCWF